MNCLNDNIPYLSWCFIQHAVSSDMKIVESGDFLKAVLDILPYSA